ncbi:MAG: segregation/condensation protein A [Lactobacillales bacterium]|jgi:segregation and condensation protein A|nr:segregation/condensation protein A [Lactobacillales bacterium]
MDELKFKLDVFEGPLDLLLHLIRKLEVDIYDIPIKEITDQFIAYINAMKVLDLDVIGDYFVMAATLMSIKAKLLLPKQELELEEGELFEGGDEDGIDPREALVEQLLEYRKFKYAAAMLKDKETYRAEHFGKDPTNVEEYRSEELVLDETKNSAIDLFLAFNKMLEKKKKRTRMVTTIENDESTIEDKIAKIIRRLDRISIKDGMKFDELFEDEQSKPEIITTFMALLELIKTQDIFIEQKGIFEDIYVFKKEKEIINE